jgi:hypothetical protein
MLTGAHDEIKKNATENYPHISGYKIKPLSEEMLCEIVDKYFKEKIDRMI